MGNFQFSSARNSHINLLSEAIDFEFTAYSPPPLSASANPDLAQAEAVASLPEGSNDCTIFAGDVHVYYHETAAPTNTDCFTGTGAPPPPPEITNPVYPSVYVVVSSLSAGNAHTRLGPTFASAIFSMMPGDLSTIAGTAGPSAAALFNFADLPCPPPDVAAADSWFYNPQVNPSRPYMPRLLPPSQILTLDPGWSSCTFPANFQFFDPPSAFPPSNGGEGPGDKKREVPAPVVTPPPAAVQWERGHPRQVVR